MKELKYLLLVLINKYRMEQIFKVDALERLKKLEYIHTENMNEL
jgi:hypothetical protein